MSRRVIGLVVAAVLAVGVLVTIMLAVFGATTQVNVEPTPPANVDGAATSGREDCTPVFVAASSEKASLLGAAASSYNATDPQVDGQCVDVRVTTKASGAAEQALAAGWNPATDGPQPTVWSPASSVWLKLLSNELTATGQSELVTAEAPSLFATPIVFAMPKPMAEALGWPDQPIGWSDLAALAADPNGWASKGHPEWGAFTLGKTHPELSTSGLAGTVGEFYAATGKTTDLRLADIADPTVQTQVAAVEAAVTHYGDTTLTFLTNQLARDQEGGTPYVSAVVVEEKSVVDYNAGNPQGKVDTAGTPPNVELVAVQPAGGTLYSDNPYAILGGASWVTAAQQQAAADFLAYLQTAEVQSTFTQAGFRTPDGELDSSLVSADYLTAAAPTPVLAPPGGSVIAGIQSTWKDLRKKARVMIVMDVSGSMEETDAGGGRSRLAAASQAARASLAEFGPTDEVGLAIFTTGIPQDYQVLVPVGPISETKAEIEAKLALAPQNGTPLYAAISRAQSDAEATLDPTRINAVVLLTDGEDTDSAITLEQLIEQIRTTRENRFTNVKVFTIGYGDGARMDVLTEISESTGARAYDATRAADIDTVLPLVMSNF